MTGAFFFRNILRVTGWALVVWVLMALTLRAESLVYPESKVLLKGIRIGHGSGKIRVVLDFSGTPEYSFALEGDRVLRVDLPTVESRFAGSIDPLPPGLTHIRLDAGEGGGLECRIGPGQGVVLMKHDFLSVPPRLYMDFRTDAKGASGPLLGGKRVQVRRPEQAPRDEIVSPPSASRTGSRVRPEEQVTAEGNGTEAGGGESDESKGDRLAAIRSSLATQARSLEEAGIPSGGGEGVAVDVTDPGENGGLRVRKSVPGRLLPAPGGGRSGSLLGFGATAVAQDTSSETEAQEEPRNVLRKRIVPGSMEQRIEDRAVAPVPVGDLRSDPLDRARTLLRMGRIREAVAEVDTILRSPVGENIHREALYFKARCIKMLAEQNEAPLDRVVDAYDAAYIRFPEADWASEALFEQGLAYARMELFYEALAAFSGVLTRYPNSPHARPALFWTGESSLRIGRLEEARKAFERVLELAPDHDLHRRTMLRLAECYFMQERYQDADRIFDELFVRWPELLTSLAAETMLVVGRTFRKAGKQQKAADLLLMAVNMYPESAVGDELMWELANSYDESGQTDKAVTTYALMSELFPRHPKTYEARLKLAKMGINEIPLRVVLPSAQLEIYRRPIEAMRSMLEEAPSAIRDRVFFELAQGEVIKGLYQEALLTFHNLMTEFPGSEWAPEAMEEMVPTLRRLILLLKRDQRDYDIVKNYEQLFLPFGIPVKDSFLLFNLAESYAELDLLEEAVSLGRESLEHVDYPELEEVLLVRMVDWETQRGNGPGTAENCKRYVERFPEGPHARSCQLRLARIRLDDKEYREAAAILLELIPAGDDPRDRVAAEASLLLGELYLETGLRSNALHYVSRAKRLLPDNVEAEFRDPFMIRCNLILADALFEQKSFDGAEEYYRQVKESSGAGPDQAWALYRLALLQRNAGDREGYLESIARLREFREVEPWLDVGESVQRLETLREKLTAVLRQNG